MTMRRALLITMTLAALALAATAVARSTGQAAAGHAAAGTVVSTKTTMFGTILVTGTGKTLYLDANDTSGHLACYGGCLKLWPPLKASGKLSAAGQARSADLGTIRLAGGSKQVTYDKHPLYTFASATSGTSGEGEGGFYVVSPAGSKITQAVTSPSKTTTTSAGY